jgi:hypothetical protein
MKFENNSHRQQFFYALNPNFGLKPIVLGVMIDGALSLRLPLGPSSAVDSYQLR